MKYSGWHTAETVAVGENWGIFGVQRLTWRDRERLSLIIAWLFLVAFGTPQGYQGQV